MVKLIGITGKKFHGKDSAAYCIESILKNKRCIKVSFASSMKYILSEMYNVDISLFESPELKEKSSGYLFGETPRHVMQKFGTIMRRYNDSVWIDILDKSLLKMNLQSDTYVIITDCRMNNEAEYIKQRGGVIYKIDASKRLECNDIVDNHITEQGIDDKYIDKVIQNNGTKEELCKQLELVIVNY